MTPNELKNCALSAVLDEPEKARDRFRTSGQCISGLFVSADTVRIDARGTSELVPSLRWLELVGGAFVLYETLIPSRAATAFASGARHYGIFVGVPFRLTFTSETKTSRGYNMKNFVFRAEEDAALPPEEYGPMRAALVAVVGDNPQTLPDWLTSRTSLPVRDSADVPDDPF